jgi:hypothetical protein
MTDELIVSSQKAFCVEHAVEYVASLPEPKLGFAFSTKGKIPINGLRHSAVGDTNGWYIWSGEDFSNDGKFFQPLHASHVYTRIIPRSRRSLDCHQASGSCSPLVLWTFGLMNRF